MTDGTRRLLGAIALILTGFLAFQARTYSERVAQKDDSDLLAGDATSLFQDNVSTWSDRVIDKAIKNLEALHSLSADFEYESYFFGEKRRGSGRYEELSIKRGRGASSIPPLESNRFLVRATLDPDESAEERGKKSENAASESDAERGDLFEIVCDADRRTWWRFVSLNGSRSLLQLSIEELENSLVQLDEAETRALNANGVTHSCGMSGMPGLGGIAGVLKRLGANYDFQPEPEIVTTNRGARFLKLHGEAKEVFWRRVRFNVGMSELSDPIKENIPASVEIYCNEDWAFPHKIVYYSAEDSKRSKTQLFSVTYSNVTRNDADVTASRFQYVQPQINSDRYDSDYLEELVSLPRVDDED